LHHAIMHPQWYSCIDYGVQHMVGHRVRIFLKSRIDCVVGAQYRLAVML
jgi:hypothetical protein